MNFAASTKITLSGGALAANVFWVSAGAITVGASSNIPGIFMAKGAITIGASSQMTGKF